MTKPIYSFDGHFDASDWRSGSLSIETIQRWAKEEDEEYEKGFLSHHKPKTKWKLFNEKIDDFIYKLFSKLL